MEKSKWRLNKIQGFARRGFKASSRNGQELDLPKGTKLDLVLDRPLDLPQ